MSKGIDCMLETPAKGLNCATDAEADLRSLTSAPVAFLKGPY